jgi:hypothetical protein
MRSGFVLAFAGLALLALGHPAMAQGGVMVDETAAGSDPASAGQDELPIVEENGLVGSAMPREEPDFFVVEGIASNDLLNVREKASAGGKVRGRLPNGVALRNLGCGEFNGAKWCQVETVDEPRLAGWVPGRYMQESYVENAFVEAPTEARIETPADWEKEPPAVPGIAPTDGDATPVEAALPAGQGTEPPAEARIEAPAALEGLAPVVPGVPAVGDAASAEVASPLGAIAEPPAQARIETPVGEGGKSPGLAGLAPANSDPVPAEAVAAAEKSLEPKAEAPVEPPVSGDRESPAAPVMASAGDVATPAEAASPAKQGVEPRAEVPSPFDRSVEPPAVAENGVDEVASPAEKMASLPAGDDFAPTEAAPATGPTEEPPAAGKRRPVHMTPLARNIAGWLVSRGMKIEGASPPEKVVGLSGNRGVRGGAPVKAEGSADVPADESAPTGTVAGQGAEPAVASEGKPADTVAPVERIAGPPANESAVATSQLPAGQSAEPLAATERAQADAASSDGRMASLSASETGQVAPASGFAATGEIPCARYYGQPMSRCIARVKRAGESSVMVTVAWPDGGQRVIVFVDGRADNSDSPDTLTYTREADLNMIRIGKAERFEIPDSLPFGG